MIRRLAQKIVDCLPVSGESERHVASLASFNRRDWDQAIDWLNLSGLTLLFWDQLKRMEREDLLPKELCGQLDRNLADHRRRVAEMAIEFDSINRCLESAEVDFAVLKGFALIPEYCPDACLRTSYDYDYLVSRGSIDRADRALRLAGYARKASQADHSIVYFRPERISGMPSHRNDLYSAELQRMLELHCDFWEPGGLGFGLDLQNEPLRRRQMRVWRGITFYALAEEDELLFQVLHVFRHVLHNWCRLCWLHEIACFLTRRSVDLAFWERFDSRIGENEPLTHIIGVVCKLISQVFRVPLPVAILDLTRKLPASLTLWVERYGRSSALDNFSRDKYSLFLHREFVHDPTTWRRIRRSRLFPMRRPPRVAQAQDSRLSSRLAAGWRQNLYTGRRLGHHLLCAVRHGWEALKWEHARVRGRV